MSEFEKKNPPFFRHFHSFSSSQLIFKHTMEANFYSKNKVGFNTKILMYIWLKPLKLLEAERKISERNAWSFSHFDLFFKKITVLLLCLNKNNNVKINGNVWIQNLSGLNVRFLDERCLNKGRSIFWLHFTCRLKTTIFLV